MKNRRQKYQDNLARLKALSHELNTMIENGSFYDLSFFNRYVYIRRVKSLYNRLLGPVTELNLQKILAAAAVVVLGTGFGTGCDEKKDDSNSNVLVLAVLAGGGTPPSSEPAVTNPFLLSNVGGDGYSAPAFVDIDADGDLDAFSGNKAGTITYWNNNQVETSATGPVFASSSENPFSLSDAGSFSKPAFVDIDGDGDLDLFVGNSDGAITYFKNTGTVSSPDFMIFSAGSNPFNTVDVNNAAPAFVDIDGDNDYDAFIGNDGGHILYYMNTGNATSPSFYNITGSSDPFNGFIFNTFVTPVFVDIDGDGDYDVFTGGWNGNIVYLENSGNETAPDFGEESAMNPFGLSDVGYQSTPAFVDIDGDGDIDAFSGNRAGDIIYFENTNS